MSFITDNLIYIPISAIMWFWHKVFASVGGVIPGVDDPESNGLIWVLSVVFLVVTLRVLLFYPMARQLRYSRKMQTMQPRMQEIRKRYKNDQQKMAQEMRALQKKEGFNPLLGCLPALLQIPVFLGLFHVLRSFNRMGSAFGALGMTAEETRTTGNYVFSPEDVQNFLDARVFGAPLSSFISQSVDQFAAFVNPGDPLDFSRTIIIIIAVPLMIVSSLMTHLNAKQSFSRQPLDKSNSQAVIMRQMMLWVFPIGILVTGAFWPIAILVYMVTNNAWTYGQQHFLFAQMDREESAKEEVAREKRNALAPRVGVKPVNPKKAGNVSDKVSPSVSTSDKAESAVAVKGGTSTAAPTSGSSPAPGSKPKPGQKPSGTKNTSKKKRKKKK
ncbi:MAG TPA: membrane protein insertase YidC [Dietzia timorensis]|uniref:Membrane protein insertase YidC n=1 Tax=Dietzia timorensis TaxID=499555 RepID=A0A921F1T3_9ACTN|nr:membrane protein insertase YidC [Dietzia timorensis]HJE90177.1 membrane protein insertase YidC [Dietzia timorensis]